MVSRNRSSTKKAVKQYRPEGSFQKVCFVISPIGKEGTEKYEQFKNVLEYVIKAAVKQAGYDLSVMRADEIDRSGSFIKDILESLFSSFVVIADLTEQNPNVFYELGVRHALRPRTILMAQSLDEIPSDLREYRAIVYDTSAKGASDFASRLKKYLDEIDKEPERPDNPVLDRIGGMTEDRIALLEAEKEDLKTQLSAVLTRGEPKQIKERKSNLWVRLRRITTIMNAVWKIEGSYHRGDQNFKLPVQQGKFRLFWALATDGVTIADFLYSRCTLNHSIIGRILRTYEFSWSSLVSKGPGFDL